MNAISSQPLHPFSLTHGARVLDRFTIQRGLGIGGFGEVYFAISDAGKEVAIKRIQRNLEVELRGVSHCLNLKHANLVSLYDVCQDASGTWWVVMEYIAGGNLREALDRSPGGLSDAEVRRWFLGAAQGLGHLHRQGLVHRDLKPGNLFDDSGVIKVGDYGLSKYISESRRGAQTESVGTFHYMAPEIGRGEYGHEIDLYALGVILYEMLTDRLPFDGDTIQEIVVKHLSAEPDLSGIAEPYRHVIERALRKDPRQRWSSAEQMVSALGGRDATLPLGGWQPTTNSLPAPHPQPLSPSFLRGEGSPNVAAGSSNRGQSSSAFQLPSIAWILLFTLVVIFVVRTGRLTPSMMLMCSISYVAVYVLRQSRQRGQPLTVDASHLVHPTVARPVAAGRAPQRLSRQAWRQQQRGRVAAKPTSTQLAELSGSWLAAAIVTVFCTVVMAWIGLRHDSLTAMHVASFAWVGVFAFLCSVCLLAIGKLWEGYGGTASVGAVDRPTSPPRGRWVLLGLGSVLGLAGYGLHQFLLLPVQPETIQLSLGTAWQRAFYDSQSHPRPEAWMMHFALLLAAVRWWRFTDPLRSRRLSLGAVAITLVVAWAVQLLVPIPQPWGLFVAGTTAAATQIAAAWESNDGYALATKTRGVA